MSDRVGLVAVPANRSAGGGQDGLVGGVPVFVTHYHRAGRRSFLSLSDLDEEQLAAVLAELATPEQGALSSRRFGPRYMALRRATEARARDLFIAAGGRPQRSAPHYFILGASAWFAGLYRDVAEVCLPLAALPADVTSATYADSITAMGLGVPLGLPAPDPEHADRVYRLEELEDLIARYGLPHDAAPERRAATPVTSTSAWTPTSRSSCGRTNPSALTSPAADPKPQIDPAP